MRTAFEYVSSPLVGGRDREAQGVRRPRRLVCGGAQERGRLTAQYRRDRREQPRSMQASVLPSVVDLTLLRSAVFLCKILQTIYICLGGLRHGNTWIHDNHKRSCQPCYVRPGS
jgi:hypothetical protein